MEKLTVTKVFVSDKSKDGVEFKSKKGEKFWKVGVKFDKYGDDWFSCLVFKEDDPVKKLQEGDERLFVIERGDYNNFKLPTRLDVLESRIEALERSVRPVVKSPLADIPDDNLDEEINPEDIPF